MIYKVYNKEGQLVETTNYNEARAIALGVASGEDKNFKRDIKGNIVL